MAIKMQLQKSKVSSVKKRKFKGSVFNFSVKEDESYISNGICVHNCRSRIVAISVDQVEQPPLNPPPKSVVEKISPNPFQTKQPKTPTNTKDSPAKKEIDKRK